MISTDIGTTRSRARWLLAVALTGLVFASVGTASAEETTTVIGSQDGFSRYVFTQTPAVTINFTTPRILLFTDCDGDPADPDTTCTDYDIPSQTAGSGESVWYRLSAFAERDPGAYLDLNHGCAEGQTGVRVAFTGTTTTTNVLVLVEQLTQSTDAPEPVVTELQRVEHTLTPKSATDQGVSLCIDG